VILKQSGSSPEIIPLSTVQFPKGNSGRVREGRREGERRKKIKKNNDKN
jgi:hypothetical protein